MTHTATPTVETYGDFQAAYERLNLDLFGGALPDVIFTLARTRHANGYIMPEGFATREEDGSTAVAEIGLNPETFERRTPKDVLSTIAHEMVHLQQYLCKTLGKHGYHNQNFADRMAAIGLQASDTGKPGGATTGQRMTHYVIEGGPFERTADELIAEGWTINYVAPAVTEEEKTRKRQRRASKTKYTCSRCGANAWGRPGLHIHCTGEAYHAPVQMIPSDDAND